MFNHFLSLLFAIQDAAPAGAATAPDAHSGSATPNSASPIAKTAEDLAGRAAKLLGSTISDTPLIGWITLLAGIFGGLIVGRIVQSMLERVGKRLKSRGWVARGAIFQYSSGPINLAITTLGISIGMTRLVLEKDVVQPFVGKAIGLLYVVAIGWFLYNLVDLIEIAIQRITTDTTIIQLIRKALRIFLLIIFALFVAQNFFGADVTAWIAGLGLAGLAVSLAAQGPIKNLFGSVTVVLDRPFGLGDRIQFGDKIGVVEVMGFRSTKLRTADGHLVTIPNSKLIEDVVENLSVRPYVRRMLNVTITYDTPPERIELAIKIIKDLLAEPFMAETFDLKDFPPRVVFDKFNSDSLNIQVQYWYQLSVEGRDWWTYSAQAERFNLKLLRAYNEAGIDFAFPSHTVYHAHDANRPVSIRIAQDASTLLREDGKAKVAS